MQKRIERAKKWAKESEKETKKGREERRRRGKKEREGKEMGTGEWEMHAGRKRAREAGVQKGERKQRNGDRRVGNARR